LILLIFWGSTIINFLGIRLSGMFSSLGVVLGTIIPGVLIISLGFWWYFSGNPININLSMESLVPDFHFSNLVLFSGIILGLAGVEIAAFHIKEAKNPQKDYPIALFMAVIIISIISILGTLAIAFVVPQQDLSLLSGLIQAFTVFFHKFNLDFLVPFIALFLFLGSIAGINTWIVGPAKGLLVTAKDGYLPPSLQAVNKHNVPVGMLLLQATIGSILTLIFLYMDDTSVSFWILTAVSIIFTVVQYGFVYAAVVKLRYSNKDAHRPFKVPGGIFGVWLIVLVGIAFCVFTFFIAFLPPEQLATGSDFTYVSLLALIFIILSLPPLVLAKLRKK
jgi:glutamate:GABA antiporter